MANKRLIADGDATDGSHWNPVGPVGAGDNIIFDEIHNITVQIPALVYGTFTMSVDMDVIFTAGTAFPGGSTISAGTVKNIIGNVTCSSPNSTGVYTLSDVTGNLTITGGGGNVIFTNISGAITHVSGAIGGGNYSSNVYTITGTGASILGGTFKTLNIEATPIGISDTLAAVNLSGATISAYAPFTVTNTGAFGVTTTGARIIKQLRVAVTQTGVSIPETWGNRVRRLIPAFN